MGKEYTPTPIKTDDVNLPRDLNLLVEKLSEHTHDVWAENRFKEGWTYGEIRDEENKKHPDLVEYKDLTEGEKEYDRKTSMNSLKAIYKLGFSIYKRTKGSILIVGEYSKEDINSFSAYVSKFDIEVVFKDNWEEAKSLLNADLTKWHSIIFDTEGKYNKNEEKSPFFLRNSLDDVISIFSKKRNEIPWYVMPSTYDEFSETLVRYTVGRNRYTNQEWGSVLFKKDDYDHLFDRIHEILPSIPNYRLKSIYSEVFDILEKYFTECEVKGLLFDVLKPLHYPDIFFSFNPKNYYANLRRVLESCFVVANRYNIIPHKVCYNEYGTVSIAACRKHFENDERCPKSVSELISNIVFKTNSGSHMDQTDTITGLNYTVLSLALQLCDIIIWLGKSIESLGKDNLSSMRATLIGKNILISIDSDGLYFYNNFLIQGVSEVIKKLSFEKHYKVEVTNVSVNHSDSNKKYPYVMEVKMLKSGTWKKQ